MRIIGRSTRELSVAVHADGLRRAAVHQRAGRALGRLSSTGIAQGVHRFHSHEEADAQVREALARVMATNAALQRRQR